MVAVGVILCHLHRFQVLETGFFGNLVFAFVSIMLQVTDVGDVAHVTYFVTEVPQVSEDQVEGDGWTGVAEVSVTVDGGTTDVHADMRSVDGFERLLATSKRIVNI